jgi:hypothetical protein
MFAQYGIEVNFTSSSVSVFGLATMPCGLTRSAWHSPSNAHAYRLYVFKEKISSVGFRAVSLISD